ncbi:MAG: ATP-binding protein [candidate division WOR-3 bacterium]
MKKKIFEFCTFSPFTKFNELRAILSESLENFRISKDKILNVVIVVDEILSNIVEHSYKFKKGPIKIKIEKDERNIIITFEDQGKPFIYKKGKADIEEKEILKKERGLGLSIVQKLIDKFDFERKGRKNIKRFYMKID